MAQINLEGQAAIVSGGNRGIGRAIVEKLAEAGSSICLTNRNAEEGKKVSEEIASQYKVSCIAVSGDISDFSHCKKVVEHAQKEFGKIDILVNNAGITKDNLFIRMKESDWDEVMDINLKGAFYLTQAVSKIMMKSRVGSIVNIGSVVGHTGNPGQVNYSTSKSALIGFTKSISKELASRNIRCNLVSPGFIETDMTGKLNEKQVEAIMQQIPLKKYGKPEDIANAVLFLSSDLSQYITGSVIHVNGGMI